MDISETTAPRSDQQNYDDVASTPRTVTVEKVTAGSAEQPVEIHLVEFPGRPYKPSKSMRRVLVSCWGPQGSEYAGRRMTLYGDPSVKFGGIAVGGIKISHLSHIDKAQTIPLTVTRGKRAPHTVEPLNDDAEANQSPAQPTQQQVQECTDRDQLRAWWQASGPERRQQIQARVAELDQPQQQEQDDDQAGFDWPPAEEPTDV